MDNNLENQWTKISIENHASVYLELRYHASVMVSSIKDIFHRYAKTRDNYRLKVLRIEEKNAKDQDWKLSIDGDEIFRQKKEYEELKTALLSGFPLRFNEELEIQRYLVAACRYYLDIAESLSLTLDRDLPEILTMDRVVHEISAIVESKITESNPSLKEYKRIHNRHREGVRVENEKKVLLERALQKLTTETPLKNIYGKITLESVAKAIKTEISGFDIAPPDVKTIKRHLDKYFSISSETIKKIEPDEQKIIEKISEVLDNS